MNITISCLTQRCNRIYTISLILRGCERRGNIMRNECAPHHKKSIYSRRCIFESVYSFVFIYIRQGLYLLFLCCCLSIFLIKFDVFGGWLYGTRGCDAVVRWWWYGDQCKDRLSAGWIICGEGGVVYFRNAVFVLRLSRKSVMKAFIFAHGYKTINASINLKFMFCVNFNYGYIHIL